MDTNFESIYWLTNKDWYKINEEKDCFEILDSAPAKAKLSFAFFIAMYLAIAFKIFIFIGYIR